MRIPDLWRNRDFTLLWCGRAASELGEAMSFVALPLLALGLGPSYLAGIVLASGTFSQAAVTLFAGAIVDRISRRRAMLVSSIVRILLYALLALSALAGSLAVWQLICVAILAGIATPFFESAQTAAIRSVVPKAELPLAYSQNQVRSTLASLAGAPLGGMLFSSARAIPFVGVAIGYAVELVAIIAIREPLGRPEGRKAGSLSRDLLEGARFIFSSPLLRASFLAVACINFAALWPLLLLTFDRADVAPSLIGLAMSCLTVATLLGAIMAPALNAKVGAGVLIISAAWLLTVACLFMAMFSETVLVVLVSMFVGMLLVPALSVLLGSFEAAVTPDSKIGRVSSTAAFISMIAAPAGQALGPLLFDTVSPRMAFLVFANAIGSGAVILTSSAAVRGLVSVGEDG